MLSVESCLRNSRLQWDGVECLVGSCLESQIKVEVLTAALGKPRQYLVV